MKKKKKKLEKPNFAKKTENIILGKKTSKRKKKLWKKNTL